MSFKDRLMQEYFEWMLDLVCGKTRPERASYKKLLSLLYATEFTYINPMDKNRASDGIDLRRRFALLRGYEDVIEYLDNPCSVLEMMIALAIRCEETLMDDGLKGDRTSQWFWKMIVNLGLGEMVGDMFNMQTSSEIIARFLNREYDADGKGGLFELPNSIHDPRTAEIWLQLNDYINRIR